VPLELLDLRSPSISMTVTVNKDAKVLQGRKMVVLCARGPFIVLWTFVAIINGPLLILALSGQRDVWVIVGMVALLGFIGTISLAHLRLTLSPEMITYRSILRTVRIQLNHVITIRGEFGLEKGPVWALVVEVSPLAQSREICINMKLFNKRDLRHLLDTAEVLDIPVHLDGMVARWLDRMNTKE
jgi:hypothetical protein